MTLQLISGGPSSRRLTRFGDYIHLVESALTEISVDNPTLKKAVDCALLTGGKRIRPVLTLLACEAVGGDFRRAVPAAVAYELAHCASLVQDDMIDKSDSRRGLPSVHNEFGLSRAILTSDILIFEIFKKLAGYGRLNLDVKRLSALLDLLGDAAKAAAIGEQVEAEFSGRIDITEQEYLEIAKGKTGAIIASAAASGAVVGLGSDFEVDALRNFGMGLGLAYQLQDDLLDVFGQADSMGKPVLIDFQNRVGNFVLVHALGKADPSVRRYLTSLMGRQLSETELIHVKRVLHKLGSVDYAMSAASSAANKGRAELMKLKPSPARQKLFELSYLIKSFDLSLVTPPSVT